MPTATVIGIRYVLLALVSVLVVQAVAMGYSWFAYGSFWQIRTLNAGVIAGVFAANILFACRHAFAAGKRAGHGGSLPGSAA